MADFFNTYGFLIVSMIFGSILGISIYLPLMAGQLSLATPGFYALGGYVSAILSTKVFTNNQVSSMNASSFNGLKKLEKLYLANNLIKSVDSTTFNNLVSLQLLNIYQNLLESIDNFLLIPLKNLTYLNLAQNDIKSIGNSFQNYINSICLSYFEFNSYDQCEVTVNTVQIEDKFCTRFNSTTCKLI